MRCLLLLLFIAGYEFVVCSAWDKITVPLRILVPDLEAFEKYYETFDKDLTAFIYWPHGITFQVKWVEHKSEGYLQIHGKFISSFLRITSRHDYLYFRNSKFYYKKKEEMFFTKDYRMYYKPPAFFEKWDSYLAIAYHTLEDLKTISVDTYSAHAAFFDKYPSRKRSVYLASWDYPVKHLLEYTFGGAKLPTIFPEGGLVSLIGKIKKNIVEMKNYRNVKLDCIVYNTDPGADLIVVTDFYDVGRVDYHAKDVFGVRMQSQAFLAEIRQGEVRMLSAHHLEASAVSPDEVILMDDLTKRMDKVEPRLCDLNDDFCMLNRPQQVKFLFNGHVLVKKVNHKESEVDKYCPIGVEFENKEMAFYFGNDRDKMICTNDEIFWRSGGREIDKSETLAVGPNTDIH